MALICICNSVSCEGVVIMITNSHAGARSKTGESARDGHNSFDRSR
jgi:hypothetical protein